MFLSVARGQNRLVEGAAKTCPTGSDAVTIPQGTFGALSAWNVLEEAGYWEEGVENSGKDHYLASACSPLPWDHSSPQRRWIARINECAAKYSYRGELFVGVVMVEERAELLISKNRRITDRYFVFRIQYGSHRRLGGLT